MLNLHRTVLRPGFSRFVLCAAVGSLLAMLLTVWIALCGTSPMSVMALGIGAVLGAIGFDWASPLLFPEGRVGAADDRMIRLVVVITQLLIVWCTPLMLDSTLLAGSETFGTGGDARTLLCLTFPALVIAMNVTLSLLLIRAFQNSCRLSAVLDVPAIATGSVLILIHGWLTFPLAATVTVCLLVAAVVCELSITRGKSREDSSVHHGSSSREFFSGLMPAASVTGRWMSIAVTFASTLLTVAGANLIRQLVPLNIPVVLTGLLMAALIISGIMLGIVRRFFPPIVAVIFSSLVLAAFPNSIALLTDWNLAITANSGLPGMLVQRSMQAGIIVAAALLPMFSLWPNPSRSANGFAGLAGMTAAFLWLGRGLPVGMLMSAGMLIHVAAAMLFLSHRSMPSARWSAGRMAILAMAILSLMPSFRSADSVTASSSLLFSHRTFAAMQRGLSRDLIHQSDANRLIETVKTTSGTISVWRRGGHVFEFQQNGVALGRVSSDVRVTPQPAEDVLPSILGLTCHPQPGRVLLLGDDTGVCLRSVTHFPVQEIMALRAESELTKLAQKYTWNSQETAADEDSRVQIRHDTPMVALRDRSLKSFDVIVTALPQFAGSSQAFQYTTEFYASIRERLNSDGGVFCQRLTQSETGPTPISQVMSALMEHFGHVGVIQSVPGELILIATNRDKGLVDPEFLSRMQRDHVRQEIARTGLDWAQVAVLPFVDARDPIGIFGNDRRPKAISVRYGGFALCQPLDTLRRADKSDELRMAFAPHQVQLASTIPINDDLREAQRRLTSLQQQLEILAGMPDQPWTYRKSLRMEMQRDPRPPVEVVKNGQIVKEPHPLDELRKEYFIALGDALQTLASSASQGSADNLQAQVRAKVDALQKFASAAEPLLSHFAHFEIIRLHELARLSSVDEEFRHRLHIVFFTTPRDASVRPVISALDQLVDRPDLVRDDQERYDLLNSLVQKLIERWEARTAWEPKSALRVQNDVEKSVRVVNLAMDQMERAAAAIHVSPGDFLRRRRFVNAALITPLRDYRDQVLAHRSRLESSRGGETPTEPNTEEANDSPLLNPQGTQGISTN